MSMEWNFVVMKDYLDKYNVDVRFRTTIVNWILKCHVCNNNIFEKIIMVVSSV